MLRKPLRRRTGAGLWLGWCGLCGAAIGQISGLVAFLAWCW